MYEAYFKISTGTRAHPCDKCSYVAKTASNLKRHMMIHSNIKKFVCPFCEDTFRQKIHLKRHIRYKHEVSFISLFVLVSGVLQSLTLLSMLMCWSCHNLTFKIGKTVMLSFLSYTQLLVSLARNLLTPNFLCT